ncbi:MAG: MBL fold metallo-hydrolase, partial [Propionibacteriaceae bacterium]
MEATMTIDPHHVEPGGPVLTAVLADGLTMIKFSVGPMDKNAYLISAGPHAVLIDAANDPDRLLEVVGATGPETVITTHQHGDHWQGLAAVV